MKKVENDIEDNVPVNFVFIKQYIPLSNKYLSRSDAFLIN